MLNVVRFGIHRTYNIGIPFVPGLLILNGTHLVATPDKQVGLVKVVTVSCLVAQRPNNHRGVIFGALKHVAGTKQMGLGPFQIIGQTFPHRTVVTHAVRLNIGLVDHIKSVLVGQIIKKGGLWVVTQANGVHIQLLHPLHVQPHIGLGNYLSGQLIELMQVNPL